MYKTIFWFLVVWTVFSLVLQLAGYQILDSIIIVLVIDLIALGIIVEVGRRKPMIEINEKVSSKIQNIENVCQSILNNTGENPLMGRIEAKLVKQKEDVSYLFDKMSRKTLELEDKINRFGLSLAENMEKFKERLEKLEKDSSTKESSFNIGETVYIDKEE
jgi:hypothetical protein